MRFLIPLFLCVPALAEPPRVTEVTPAPKIEQPPATDPIDIEKNKVRIYRVTIKEGDKVIPFPGPVTWHCEGEAVGTREVDKAKTLMVVVSGQDVLSDHDVEPGHLVVWGQKNGPAKVTAWGVVEGKAKLLQSMVFQVGPRGPPIDDKKTDPVPIVVTGKLYAAIVIEDPNNYPTNRGELILAFNTWCDANGVKRRWAPNNVVDASGHPPADMVPWLGKAFGMKQPCWFLVTEKGEILFKGDLPTTRAAIIDTLTQIKGK